MTEVSELPSGWEWRGGSRGESYYTINFGTSYTMGGDLAGVHGLGGYDGQVTWDEGGSHIVDIWPIERIDENDDPQLGYSVESGLFNSEQEALNAVPEMIQSLKEHRS